MKWYLHLIDGTVLIPLRPTGLTYWASWQYSHDYAERFDLPAYPITEASAAEILGGAGKCHAAG